jgi:hypothetical protein
MQHLFTVRSATRRDSRPVIKLLESMAGIIGNEESIYICHGTEPLTRYTAERMKLRYVLFGMDKDSCEEMVKLQAPDQDDLKRSERFGDSDPKDISHIVGDCNNGNTLVIVAEDTVINGIEGILGLPKMIALNELGIRNLNLPEIKPCHAVYFDMVNHDYRVIP